MGKFIFFIIFFITFLSNFVEITSGEPEKKKYESISCVSSKIDGKTSNSRVKKNSAIKEYNCGMMGVGVIRKIPYHENFDPIHVDITSACVKCGICLVIADKINETLMILHDAPSSDQWVDYPEAGGLLETLCQGAFLRYRLREIDGKRYIGDNVPGSKIVESTADNSWEENLEEKCEEIMTTVGPKKIYKYWKEGCKGFSPKLAEILCHGKMGVLRDCRGIINKS